MIESIYILMHKPTNRLDGKWSLASGEHFNSKQAAFMAADEMELDTGPPSGACRVASSH